MGGHGAALREALRKFAGENPYGYGEIGLAWPASFGKRAEPQGQRPAPPPPLGARREEAQANRRSAYVDIATLLIPAAKAAKLQGLVKAARDVRRASPARRTRSSALQGPCPDPPSRRAGHAARAGVGHRRREGARRGRQVRAGGERPRARRPPRRQSLELLTKLENGIQIITIPLVVRDQLKAIDQMTGASAEHKAATLAFVLGRAIKNGVVSVRAIRPGEQTQFYDDPRTQQAAHVHRRPGSPARRAAAVAAVAVAAVAARPAHPARTCTATSSSSPTSTASRSTSGATAAEPDRPGPRAAPQRPPAHGGPMGGHADRRAARDDRGRARGVQHDARRHEHRRRPVAAT